MKNDANLKFLNKTSGLYLISMSIFLALLGVVSFVFKWDVGPLLVSFLVLFVLMPVVMKCAIDQLEEERKRNASEQIDVP